MIRFQVESLKRAIVGVTSFGGKISSFRAVRGNLLFTALNDLSSLTIRVDGMADESMRTGLYNDSLKLALAPLSRLKGDVHIQEGGCFDLMVLCNVETKLKSDPIVRMTVNLYDCQKMPDFSGFKTQDGTTICRNIFPALKHCDAYAHRSAGHANDIGYVIIMPHEVGGAVLVTDGYNIYAQTISSKIEKPVFIDVCSYKALMKIIDPIKPLRVDHWSDLVMLSQDHFEMRVDQTSVKNFPMNGIVSFLDESKYSHAYSLPTAPLRKWLVIGEGDETILTYHPDKDGAVYQVYTSSMELDVQMDGVAILPVQQETSVKYNKRYMRDLVARSGDSVEHKFGGTPATMFSFGDVRLVIMPITSSNQISA